MIQTFDFEFERRKVSTPASMLTNHFHEAYEIYYLCSGERQYFIKNRTYRIQPGDLVFIRKNELHKTMEANRPAHERLLIYFHERFLQSFQGDGFGSLMAPFHADSHVLRLSPEQQEAVYPLLLGIEREAQNSGPGAELYVKALLAQLLLHCGRLLPQPGIAAAGHAGTPERKIDEIVDYINARFKQPLSLAHISQEFYISVYHFSRLFREVTGFTFVEYVTSLRTMDAQRQLRDTRDPVLKIAESAGFDSIAHFNRVFRKITGCSPSEFRKRAE